jgi:hypothetical protein
MIEFAECNRVNAVIECQQPLSQDEADSIKIAFALADRMDRQIIAFVASQAGKDVASLSDYDKNIIKLHRDIFPKFAR